MNRAVAELVSEKLLEPPSLVQHLAGIYSGAELKALSKTCGTPQSGPKEKVAQRLADADPTAMASLVRPHPAWICSARGRARADEYKAEKRFERDKAEQETIEFLRLRRLQAAALAVAQYESRQLFARGIGVDWSRYDPAEDTKLLDLVFLAVPAILTGVSPDAVQPLRIAASMALLWGTGDGSRWISPDTVAGITLPRSVAVRMFMFYARHKRELERWPAWAGAPVIAVMPTGDARSCAGCRALAGRAYSITDVPELPHARCTSGDGCRCTYSMRAK
ncbi:MAG: hypothetical protein EXR86_16690 [Gammaproteobacteria bacterium]|nr:hypothetical protein [Gammaproteobacteria bacterium]